MLHVETARGRREYVPPTGVGSSEAEYLWMENCCCIDRDCTVPHCTRELGEKGRKYSTI